MSTDKQKPTPVGLAVIWADHADRRHDVASGQPADPYTVICRDCNVAVYPTQVRAVVGE